MRFIYEVMVGAALACAVVGFNSTNYNVDSILKLGMVLGIIAIALKPTNRTIIDVTTNDFEIVDKLDNKQIKENKEICNGESTKK